jgi:hypothetical protein
MNPDCAEVTVDLPSTSNGACSKQRSNSTYNKAVQKLPEPIYDEARCVHQPIYDQAGDLIAVVKEANIPTLYEVATNTPNHTDYAVAKGQPSQANNICDAVMQRSGVLYDTAIGKQPEVVYDEAKGAHQPMYDQARRTSERAHAKSLQSCVAYDQAEGEAVEYHVAGGDSQVVYDLSHSDSNVMGGKYALAKKSDGGGAPGTVSYDVATLRRPRKNRTESNPNVPARDSQVKYLLPTCLNGTNYDLATTRGRVSQHSYDEIIGSSADCDDSYQSIGDRRDSYDLISDIIVPGQECERTGHYDTPTNSESTEYAIAAPMTLTALHWMDDVGTSDNQASSPRGHNQVYTKTYAASMTASEAEIQCSRSDATAPSRLYDTSTFAPSTVYDMAAKHGSLGVRGTAVQIRKLASNRLNVPYVRAKSAYTTQLAAPRAGSHMVEQNAAPITRKTSWSFRNVMSRTAPQTTYTVACNGGPAVYDFAARKSQALAAQQYQCGENELDFFEAELQLEGSKYVRGFQTRAIYVGDVTAEQQDKLYTTELGVHEVTVNSVAASAMLDNELQLALDNELHLDEPGRELDLGSVVPELDFDFQASSRQEPRRTEVHELALPSVIAGGRSSKSKYTIDRATQEGADC